MLFCHIQTENTFLKNSLAQIETVSFYILFFQQNIKDKV